MSRTFYPSDEYDSRDLELGNLRHVQQRRQWFKYNDDDDDDDPLTPAAAARRPRPLAPLTGAEAQAA
jgi:hypothetical protein